MAERKDYVVEITETVVHEYTVNAQSSEEAESIASNLLDDGEEGEITSTYIEGVESIAGSDYAAEESDE